jgi:hypothetical protein
MKTLKYIFLFILVVGFSGACLVDDEETYLENANGYNVVTFEKVSLNLGALANGDEYQREVRLKLVGPQSMELTSDITATVEADESSTAIAGVHYRIDNPTVTLSASNNYLANLQVTMLTEGNQPPEDGTPEMDEYVAPVLKLKVVSATGDPKVSNSGKPTAINLNFVRPNPFVGKYIAHIIYRHPSYGVYPDNIYVEEDNEKTLIAVTGRKCETEFAIWGPAEICWITINADNSIVFTVADTWPYAVKLGDPNRPDLESHYDPDTGIIYLYYHYEGAGGARIFWETFTPNGPIGQ